MYPQLFYGSQHRSCQDLGAASPPIKATWLPIKHSKCSHVLLQLQSQICICISGLQWLQAMHVFVSQRYFISCCNPQMYNVIASPDNVRTWRLYDVRVRVRMCTSCLLALSRLFSLLKHKCSRHWVYILFNTDNTKVSKLTNAIQYPRYLVNTRLQKACLCGKLERRTSNHSFSFRVRGSL